MKLADDPRWENDILPDLIRSIFQRAKPWPEVFSDYLRKAPAAAAENLLQQLRLAGENLDRLLARCPSETAVRVRELAETTGAARSLCLDRLQVVEQSHGLFVNYSDGARGGRARQELICDAVLRIERIINHRAIGQVYYEGSILHEQKEVRFYALREEVEKNPLGWMRDYLLQQGAGYLRYHPKWNKRLLLLAMQFHPPLYVNGAQRIGWNEDGDRFVLPRYYLTMDGQTHDDTQGLLNCGDVIPGLPLTADGAPTPAFFGQLPATAWAILACLTANILAPAYRQPPCGIALVDEFAAQWLAVIASDLGLLHRDMAVRGASKLLLALEQSHRWPIAVFQQMTMQSKVMKHFMQHPSKRNCCIWLPRAEAIKQLLDNNWMVIASDPGTDWLPRPMLGADRWLSAYLKDVCQRRLQLQQDPLGHSNSLARQVLYDMRQFATQQNGETQSLELASDRITTLADRDAAKCLLELMVLNSKSTGRVVIQDADAPVPGKNVTVLQQIQCRNYAGVRIPKAKLMAELGLSAATVEQPLGQLLQRRSVLLEETPEELIVLKDWVVAELQKLQPQSLGLRVIG